MGSYVCLCHTGLSWNGTFCEGSISFYKHVTGCIPGYMSMQMLMSAEWEFLMTAILMQTVSILMEVMIVGAKLVMKGMVLSSVQVCICILETKCKETVQVDWDAKYCYALWLVICTFIYRHK